MGKYIPPFEIIAEILLKATTYIRKITELD